MYWLNYLDRNAIALARLNDLEEELSLTSTQSVSAILVCGHSAYTILDTRLACPFSLPDTFSDRFLAICSSLA
jgi:hypothetical protein